MSGDWRLIGRAVPVNVIEAPAGLRPGDQWRGARSGRTYTVLDEDWSERDDGRRVDHTRYADAYRRREEVPDPARAGLEPERPRITEVVCSRCGEPLGEFSDGSTPRSRRGRCCTDVPSPRSIGSRAADEEVDYDDDHDGDYPDD